MRPADRVAGRFVIEREVAAGGMGRIYRALDEHTGAGVAIKVILDPEGGEVERFLREAVILSEIRHPAVVRYVAHGQTAEQQHYLAMEWLDGTDLAKLLKSEDVPTTVDRGAPTRTSTEKQRGLSIRESLSIARRIGEALGELHRRGLVHRDVKPSNVFLVDGSADQPKLLDFGVARVQHAAMTGTGVLVGTPMYMAPEQARGARDLDARADVWALGCVLFECLVGQAPFRGSHAMAILAKILLEDPPRLRDVYPAAPALLDALLVRLLAKDPAERPPDGASAARLIEEIDRAIEGGAADERPARERAAAPSRWFAPATGTATPTSISGEERRVQCVVLAGALPTNPNATLASGVDSGVADELRTVVEAHGGRLELLRDGSLLASVAGARSAVDQAARAARVALAIRVALPRARMIVVTGRTEGSGAIPVGALIDRGVRDLALTPLGVTRLDAPTADLLESRFVLRREAERVSLVSEREGELEERKLLGRRTSLVGRDRELRAIEGIWEECLEEPVARAVLITAPAGAGKTRVRSELVRRVRARSDDVEVLFAGGDSVSAGSPFVMIAPALRRSAGILDGEPIEVRRDKLRARIERHVPEADRARINEFLGELCGIPAAHESEALRAARRDPMLMGDAMRAAFESFLAAEVAAHPVLLVLEDLHWGDLPSVRFIDGALRTLRDSPWMVLALARPEVHTQFPSLWTERAVQEIRLDALSRKASEKLVREVLRESDDATVAVIVERAGGNAFFLEELIRAAARGDGAALPDTVLATLQARLDALGSEAKRVLRAASVFGEVFWRGGVHALTAGDRQSKDLAVWLDELVEREVIGRAPRARIPDEQEFAFRHALVRDAAYETLVDRDRVLAHRLAAEWLERAGETDALVLGEHFARGEEPQRAAAWFRRAAEQALEGNDLAGAIARAERALPSADPETRGVLRMLQATAAYWSSAYADAQRWAEEASSLLQTGSVAWFRACAEGAVSSARRGEYDKVDRFIAAVRAAKPREDAVSAQIVALCRGTFQLIFAGRFDAADEILAELPGSDDPATAAQVHHVRGVRWAHGGRVGQFLVELEAAIACFEQAGDVRNATLERPTVGWCYAELGDFERAEEILRPALAQCERLGIQQTRTYAMVNLGYVLSLRSALGEARAVLEEAGALCRAQGNPRLEGWSRVHLAGVHLHEGDALGAEREARAAEELLTMAPGLRAWARATLARALLIAGRADDALPHATLAMEDLQRLGSMLQGESLPPLVIGEVRRAVGDEAGATAAFAEAKRRLLLRADALPNASWRETFLALPDHLRTLALAG